MVRGARARWPQPHLASELVKARKGNLHEPSGINSCRQMLGQEGACGKRSVATGWSGRSCESRAQVQLHGTRRLPAPGRCNCLQRISRDHEAQPRADWRSCAGQMQPLLSLREASSTLLLTFGGTSPSNDGS